MLLPQRYNLDSRQAHFFLLTGKTDPCAANSTCPLAQESMDSYWWCHQAVQFWVCSCAQRELTYLYAQIITNNLVSGKRHKMHLQLSLCCSWKHPCWVEELASGLVSAETRSLQQHGPKQKTNTSLKGPAPSVTTLDIHQRTSSSLREYLRN